ncbi:MAG: NapC/NirT family cytochrome c, partial [Acidobacteriota bacterium]
MKALSLAGGLAIALGLIAVIATVEATSRPTFCGTCHIMKPYYESWSTSRHNKVACVECHIAPGVTAEVRKKYEALSMVVKYFTRTYGTAPWAEVEDSACLLCHERRLLEGRVTFEGVSFDHRPHLIEMRRGKRLRCTSCHGQIVQGTHVAVTSTTCALCHFKGQVPGQETARCEICHDVPEKVFDLGGTKFDHAEVKRYGMTCTWCHVSVVKGDGAVPKERCFGCHNEASRLARYGEGELLHQIHVTEHKVDCLNCHLEIQHGKALLGVETPSAAAPRQETVPECSTCHSAGHSAQEQLYRGTGGHGVEPMPSAMFLAGVRCEGCHTTRRGVVDYATAVSCMACHGPRYLKIFEGWQNILKKRLSEAEAALENARQKLGAVDDSFQKASHNVDIAKSGHGIHNVPYALTLIENAERLVNDRLKEKGIPVRERLRSAFEKEKCYACHQGVELQAGAFAGVSFKHEVHLLRAGLTCAACHRPHEERGPHEVVRFGKEGCV